MSTTASSKSSRIYDPIRRRHVADTPEERVRQALLYQMLGTLAFPRGLIAVEKKIESTERRVDILVYAVQGSELKPLLLVECKAEQQDEVTWAQAVGYNDTLAAPFVCIAHAGGIRTFWRESMQLKSIGFLPPYAQLVQRLNETPKRAL